MKALNPLWIVVLMYSLVFAGLPVLVFCTMPDRAMFNVPFLLISNGVAWLYPTMRAVIKMQRHLCGAALADEGKPQ